MQSPLVIPSYNLRLPTQSSYRIYSIKLRSRSNAAYGSKITNKGRPGINAAPNHKNTVVFQGLQEKITSTQETRFCFFFYCGVLSSWCGIGSRKRPQPPLTSSDRLTMVKPGNGSYLWHEAPTMSFVLPWSSLHEYMKLSYWVPCFPLRPSVVRLLQTY